LRVQFAADQKTESIHDDLQETNVQYANSNTDTFRYEAPRKQWLLIPSSRTIRCLSAAAIITLDAGLLARSQYPEGPTTGLLDTGFSWFPWV
jgi:hypothetical protein